MNPKTQTYIYPGMYGYAVMPYSEVCMHMRVAGKPMHFRFNPDGRCVQLLEIKDGVIQEFSAPITTGEAGIYSDRDRYYYYRAVSNG